MMRSLVFLSFVALTGCAAGSANSPSLLPRAIEQGTFDEPAPAPPAVVTPDPALDAKVATLLATARRTRDDFAAADRRAAPALAAGTRAPIGSDAWLDAQTALAALDEQRAALLATLTELEELAIARAAAGQPPYPALEAARADTDAALDTVSVTVAERKARLPL